MRLVRKPTPPLIVAAWCVAAAPVAARQSSHPPHNFFELGDFPLESGQTLQQGRVLYVTHGTLNADSSNAVLLPSWYGGNHHGYDFLIGPEGALDPSEYFVIVTEMFGSGGSSSPSTMPPGQSHADFPLVTVRDNVQATYRLVTEHFRLRHLRAIIGFSMGAQQAFQWAVSHPDFMDLIVPIAGTAKTYPHGIIRLESALTLINQDPSILAGHDTLSTAGTRAWSLHWAAWTRSTEWWRLSQDRTEVLRNALDPGYSAARSPGFRPHDQVVQGRAWQMHDVGETPGFGGNVERALASIRAHVLYMPGATDMYFPVTDAEYERQFIRDVDFRPIPSIWGHTAGAGPNPEDRAFLNEAIRSVLD